MLRTDRKLVLGKLNLIVVGSALTLLVACRPAEEAVAPEVRPVRVVTVGSGGGGESVSLTGRVQAESEVNLAFRVDGRMISRAVSVGDTVTAGQEIARLNPENEENGLRAAEATLQGARGQLIEARANEERNRSLLAQNFISQAAFDRITQLANSAQAQVDAAQAQVGIARNRLGYTRLLADAGGVVTGVDAEVGQVVAAGTPVVRLAQDGPRDVVFAVPEDRVAAVRVGQPVTVRAWASDGQWHGSVREVAAAADPVTRTYAVKVALAGEAPPLGATVTVVPQQSGAQGAAVIKLPTSALRREGAGTAVWVFDEASSSVRSQPVQVAGADGNEAVIADGLTPGMRVVASGVHVLAPGQKVSVYQSKTATAPAKPAQAATNNVANEPAPPAVAASR